MHRALLISSVLTLSACPGPIADCFCGPGQLALDVPLTSGEVALGVAPAGCRHITRVPLRELTGRLDGPFQIKSVTTTNAAFQVGMQDSVPGGALVFLNVISEVPADATSDLTATVTIETNLHSLVFPMRLRVGRVEDIVPSLDFGGVKVGSVGAITFDVSHIAPLSPPRGVSRLQGDAFDYANVDLTATQVRFLPPRLGRFAGEFSIDALKCVGSDMVRFVGDGVDEVVTPRATTIDFGDVAVGTTASRTVTVENRALTTVSFMQDVPEGPFRVSGVQLPPATREADASLTPGTASVLVEFTPVATGPASRTIRLWGGALEAPVLVDLSLSGAGVP